MTEEDFSLNNTKIDEDNLSNLIEMNNAVKQTFTKNNITLKDVYGHIDKANKESEESAMFNLFTKMFAEFTEKTNLNMQNQFSSLINDFKRTLNTNEETSFENKFKTIINKVKNNFKSIIKLEDEVKGLRTHI